MTWLFVRNEWTIQNEWMQRNGFCGQIIWQMSIDLSQHAHIICLIAYIPPHSFRFYREIFIHTNAKTKSKPGFLSEIFRMRPHRIEWNKFCVQIMSDKSRSNWFWLKHSHWKSWTPISIAFNLSNQAKTL